MERRKQSCEERKCEIGATAAARGERGGEEEGSGKRREGECLAVMNNIQ